MIWYIHGLFASHFYNLLTLAAKTGCLSGVCDVSPICKDTQLLPRRMCDWLSLCSSLPPKHASRKSEIWQQTVTFWCPGFVQKESGTFLHSSVAPPAFGLSFTLFFPLMLPMTLDLKRIKFCNWDGHFLPSFQMQLKSQVFIL